MAEHPAPPPAPVSLSDACRRLGTYAGRVHDLLAARGFATTWVGTARVMSEEQFEVIAADHVANPAKVGRPKSAVPAP